MTLPTKPLAREDLAVVELDGEAVIYDESENALHHLNPTATVVFSLCDGSATIAELARELGEAYGLPRTEIEPQIRGLLRRLRRSGLLEPVGT